MCGVPFLPLRCLNTLFELVHLGLVRVSCVNICKAAHFKSLWSDSSSVIVLGHSLAK